LIGDNDRSKQIYAWMKAKRHDYFLFDPDKAHYVNTMTIYQSIWRYVQLDYYGDIEKVKPNKPVVNAFRNCLTPLDTFHWSWIVNINIAQTLGWVGVLLESNGKLKL